MTVFANGKSIIHKGHGMTQLATAPDVCKTPSPGGPVPIPYPNMSPDSNLTDGAATVLIQGNPVGNTGSTLSRSNGDEPGTAGGIISSKNMGAFGWSAGSTDVEAEGKGVVRMLDAILTNGNSYNDGGLTIGQGTISYGDDKKCPRVQCKLGRDPEKHRVAQDPHTANLSAQLANEVSKWSNKSMGGRGRMVGVARCHCGKVYKAVSGAGPEDDEEIKALDRQLLVGKTSTLCNSVKVPSDPVMREIINANGDWKCAAVKIMSQSSGHTIVAMLERWVGKIIREEKNGKLVEVGRQTRDMTKTTPALFPLAQPGGSLLRPQADWVKDFDRNEVASGDGVPSCGRCQAFLPAFICEQTPC